VETRLRQPVRRQKLAELLPKLPWDKGLVEVAENVGRPLRTVNRSRKSKIAERGECSADCPEKVDIAGAHGEPPAENVALHQVVDPDTTRKSASVKPLEAINHLLI
jgi:hypothetical protein